MSESGIYYWVVRFAKDAVRKAREFKPIIGDIWIADETVIKAGNRNIWYWDIIDSKSRFLLASHISKSRTTKDCALLMKKAYTRAGKAPKRIITDKLATYLDGIELVFGAHTKHSPSKPFTIAEDSTNKIERFHGTLKDRINVVRGFANMDTAQLLTDAWLVHYNFLKEHSALGDIPPGQAMGKTVPFKDWQDIVETAQTAPEFKLEDYTVSSPTRRIRETSRRIIRRKTPRISKRRPRITPPMPTISQIRVKK